jgi:hypothetical protein
MGMPSDNGDIPKIEVVDEVGLDAFRADRLQPRFWLDELAKHERVLGNIAVGVGKSYAADLLLNCPETYEQYDVVIYVAPELNIINERAIVNGQSISLVPFKNLNSRPSVRCGALGSEWAEYERQGCSAYAKANLCAKCPHFSDIQNPCKWPYQLATDHLKDVKLFFLTDQRLAETRTLIPFLKKATGAQRMLLILDEAKCLDVTHKVVLSFSELRNFHDAVKATHGISPKLKQVWLTGITTLLAANEGLHDDGWAFPKGMQEAASIEGTGIRLFGKKFRYLGYDIGYFACSRTHERWRDSQGIHFISRPMLSADTLVLGAHLKTPYVAHRMGIDTIHSPFDNIRFSHSGTRFYNIKNGAGMASLFSSKENMPRIIEFFAALIARNIAAGKTTALVSRNKFTQSCAKMLRERLLSIGLDVDFICEGFDGLGPPDPRVIPILHYGMLGTNTFIGYETCYCLNSYYRSNDDIINALQENLPDPDKIALCIKQDPQKYRRMIIDDPKHSYSGLDRLGDQYIAKLEADVVLQVVGRVRPFTYPREVIIFQLHDLRSELPGLVEFTSLAEAYVHFGVPHLFEFQKAVTVAQLKERKSGGVSVTKAARAMGISRSTAYRRLKESSQNPY